MQGLLLLLLMRAEVQVLLLLLLLLSVELSSKCCWRSCCSKCSFGLCC